MTCTTLTWTRGCGMKCKCVGISVVTATVCNAPIRVLGASPSSARWAGHGIPSPPCHQITSSYLEVSPPSERRWVRLTQRSVAAKDTFFCWSELWNEGCFVFCLPGDAWLYYVSKNEWKPFKHSHTGRPRQVPLKHRRTMVCFRAHFKHCWYVFIMVCVCLCVFQVVAHSMLRTWWRSVCVWRVCKQPISSTDSCERPFLPWWCTHVRERFWMNSELSFPSTGTQQRVVDLQRPAQITSPVSAIVHVGWLVMISRLPLRTSQHILTHPPSV